TGASQHFVNLWMDKLMLEHGRKFSRRSAREIFLKTRDGLPRRRLAVRQWQRFRGNKSAIADRVERVGDGRHVEMPLTHRMPIGIGEMNVADFVARVANGSGNVRLLRSEERRVGKECSAG